MAGSSAVENKLTALLKRSKRALNTNNSIENSRKYLKAEFDNTYYLGYRDIPQLIKTHVKEGRKALDYGCGTGRSTRFLNHLGFETLGVDISSEMLMQASKLGDTSHYLHIPSAEIPVLNDSYDLVFSCFVLFTVPTKGELFAIFREIHRCLRKGGVCIAVTGSEALYSYPWLSYNVDFPENKNLHSGQEARIYLKDLDIEFTNYYWTDENYTELFDLSGFTLEKRHLPLGLDEERDDWVSETERAPYVTYVLRKE